MIAERALTFASNRFGESNLTAIIGLAPALVFVVVSMIATCLVAFQAFRQQCLDSMTPKVV